MRHRAYVRRPRRKRPLEEVETPIRPPSYSDLESLVSFRKVRNDACYDHASICPDVRRIIYSFLSLRGLVCGARAFGEIREYLIEHVCIPLRLKSVCPVIVQDVEFQEASAVRNKYRTFVRSAEFFQYPEVSTPHSRWSNSCEPHMFLGPNMYKLPSGVISWRHKWMIFEEEMVRGGPVITTHLLHVCE